MTDLNMDPAWLARTGASAIVSVMVTNAWTSVRSRLAKLFARQDPNREQAENGRLEEFAAELTTRSERDVQNELRGFLVARLGDDQTLVEPFLALVKDICGEIGLGTPTHWTTINAPGSYFVEGDAYVESGAEDRIVWEAMTSQDAAHKLETLEYSHAVRELARMEATSAARRLFHVKSTHAADLLSRMYEGLAATLLSRMSAPHSAELLALMIPRQGAAVLEHTDADWAVARLSEMDPDRALVLIGALGQKRTDDLLEAMERQEAVKLLRSVSRVLDEQKRMRTTFEIADQESKRIRSEAERRGQEIEDQARQRAAELIADAEREAAAKRQANDHGDPDLTNPRTQAEKKILDVFLAAPDKMFTTRRLTRLARVTMDEASSALSDLERTGKVCYHPRAKLYSLSPSMRQELGNN
jgi:MgtE intracellular N domain